MENEIRQSIISLFGRRLPNVNISRTNDSGNAGGVAEADAAGNHPLPPVPMEHGGLGNGVGNGAAGNTTNGGSGASNHRRRHGAVLPSPGRWPAPNQATTAPAEATMVTSNSSPFTRHPTANSGSGFTGMLRRRRSGEPVPNHPPVPASNPNRRSTMGPPVPQTPATTTTALVSGSVNSTARSTNAIAISNNTDNATYRIRLVPHLENQRSLRFDPISREVHQGDAPLRIGRFTDRHTSNTSSVGNRLAFKSKVVSRGHAEVWIDAGKFFIKDTKSSSGTFLNHQRLAPPSTESRPHPLKDGDILQLGVDFQGGTEDIYKCVKIRVEIGREWQKTANAFNSQAMKTLRALSGANADGDQKKKSKNAGTDCCICLFGLQICQAIFIAPCSHSFHYKCIRPLLEQQHPGFSCPLCRTFADLNEDVEVEEEGDLDEASEVECEFDKEEDILNARPETAGGPTGSSLNVAQNGLTPSATAQTLPSSSGIVDGPESRTLSNHNHNRPSTESFDRNPFLGARGRPPILNNVPASHHTPTAPRVVTRSVYSGGRTYESDAEMHERSRSRSRDAAARRAALRAASEEAVAGDESGRSTSSGRRGDVTDAEFSMPPPPAYDEERSFDRSQGMSVDVEAADADAVENGGRDVEVEVELLGGESGMNSLEDERSYRNGDRSLGGTADETHVDVVVVGEREFEGDNSVPSSPPPSVPQSQSQPNLGSSQPLRGRSSYIPSGSYNPFVSRRTSLRLSGLSPRSTSDLQNHAQSEGEGTASSVVPGFLNTLLRRRGGSVSAAPGSQHDTLGGDSQAEDNTSGEGRVAGVGEKRKR